MSNCGLRLCYSQCVIFPLGPLEPDLTKLISEGVRDDDDDDNATTKRGLNQELTILYAVVGVLAALVVFLLVLIIIFAICYCMTKPTLYTLSGIEETKDHKLQDF